MIFSILLVGAFGFVGCKKSDTFSSDQKSEITPNYSSYDEASKELDKVLSMSEDERREYELAIGKVSLITHSYKIYEELDFDNLTDESEIYSHINNHPDFLEIKVNDQGEKEFRTLYSDNIYSYLVGVNRMLILDTICLKVFDDGLITTSMKHYDELLSIKEHSLVNYKKVNHYNLYINNNIGIFEKTNCGTSREATETNNKNRTKLWIDVKTLVVNDVNYGNVPTVDGYGQIRSYKKTLGIWAYARRTIEGRIKLDVTYTVTSGVNVIAVNQLISPNLSYTQVRRFGTLTWPDYPTNLHFSSIQCWGDTPDTATAYINCN